jgi:uncharacterized phage protein gp47/JayE
MITRPTFDEMLRRTWNKVSAQTGLTNDSESGFAANILRVFCQELTDLWDELEFIESQGLLSSATGTNLDKIGQFFGVARRAAVASSTVGGALSVVFTNNRLVSVTVPIHTRVWPSSDPSISYYTAFQIVIQPGSREYVDVVAAAPGEYYNIGAGRIDSHDVGLLDLSVTNELPITTGSDLESDANYRVRIQQEIYRKEGANLTAIRSYLLDVPGVRDVQILNLARGTGTLDVLIYGYDRVVPDSVIQECQRVLDENTAAGISAIAKAPVVKFVDVTVKLVVKPGAAVSSVKSMVSAAVRGYLDNLPIEDSSGNGSIIYSELAARVQEASSDIVDSDVSMTIDGLPSLKANQLLDPGERFVSRVINVS